MLQAAILVLEYLLTMAALLPGLLVIVEQGYAKSVGGWMWLVVPASLLAYAAMLHLTLRSREAFGAAGG